MLDKLELKINPPGETSEKSNRFQFSDGGSEAFLYIINADWTC